MSLSYSYPGIYIQELPSSSNAIIPAPTSIAAFVGYSHPFQTEEFNTRQECFSFNDYMTYFGPLFSSGLVDASLPRAVYQFFLNGGSTAWVVGLQPGLFDQNGDIINRLGAANGGLTITASTSGGPSADVPLVLYGPKVIPTISSLSPASITEDDALTLTISGSDFALSAKVNWTPSGATTPTSLTPTAVSGTSLTVQVPSTDVAPAGTATVTVVNSAGFQSPPANFTVNATNQVPTIASLAPASIPAGDAPFTLTVLGSNFVPGSTIEWGGHATTHAPTQVSDTELTVVITTAEIGNTAGNPNVIVVNPTPGGPSAPAAFSVTAAVPAPSIASIAPARITAGDAGGAHFTLTVQGGNFVPDTTVNWTPPGATAPIPPLTPATVSATLLTVQVSAANVANPGTAVVSVTNPGAAGGTSPGIPFTINGSYLVPAISSVSIAGPPSGPFTLTVNGSNFVPASVVNLYNSTTAPSPPASPTTALAAAPAYVFSDSQLTATVPAADLPSAGGMSYVAVVNPQGATGLIFTALELTDVVPMNVTITNVRSGGGTFDVIVTYGTRIETYRGVQLAGSPGQQPAGMINNVSALIRVNPVSAAGYGTSITAQQLSLTLDIPVTLSTCFSAADFTEGDQSTVGVFEPNSSLDNLEIFNLLLVPGVTDFSIISAALAFAERKRAFLIVDPPPQSPAFGSSAATPQPIEYWMEGLNGPTGPSLPTSQNGAFYFPYLVSNDPVTGDNIPMAPSGFVAGIYAQTDASRGVWKAPAGLATVVLNTSGPVLPGVMNDPQQGVLNLDSINCLRSFSGVGTVVWGARTLVAQNVAYQQWMYVPVRRMTLFIEQTLLANLRWVVFEPNDEPLWIAIVNSISTFLLSLFRQGALQGSTPSQAFQVKCDATTTTPADQAQGIVNIVVAFAPLKPAEFVVIQIAQLAGQTAGS